MLNNSENITFTDLTISKEELFNSKKPAPFCGTNWLSLWIKTNSWIFIDFDSFRKWVEDNGIDSKDYSYTSIFCGTLDKNEFLSPNTEIYYYFVISFRNEEDAVLFKLKDGENYILINNF